MNQMRLLVAIGILVAVLAGAWVLFNRSAAPIMLPVAKGDSVASWYFTGAYSNNSELEAKAQAEIADMRSLIGNSEEFTDYQLYIQIATQYELLGDGAQAYAFLNKAAAIDPVHTGLAWANLGELMERLGAFNTGRIAYAKAVEAQSSVMGYHTARLAFLIQHFSNDTEAVEGAFGEAQAKFGDAPQILQLKAQWLTSLKKFSEAIMVWRQMRAQVAAEMQPSIDREIERLKRKL